MKSQNAFGGASIIAVGDLFELKPDFDKWIFDNGTDCYSALASNIWKDHVTLFELTEIMRQEDDVSFAELFNRLLHKEKEPILKMTLKH